MSGRSATWTGARLRLLGGFGLDVDEQLPAVPPPAVQRLVAFLALAGPTSRALLAGRLWPDRVEQQAQACLRSALYRAHQACPVIAASDGVVQLDACVSVDVFRLRTWSRAAVQDPANAPMADDELLCGILLPGWYDEWVVVEREYLIQLRAQALEAVARRLADEGSFAQALDLAYAVLRSEPWRETAHRTVVKVLLAQGNRSAALRHASLFHLAPEVTSGTRASGCDVLESS